MRHSSGLNRQMKSEASPGSVNGRDSRSYSQGADVFTGLEGMGALNESVEVDQNETKLHELNRDVQTLLIGLEKRNGKSTKI